MKWDKINIVKNLIPRITWTKSHAQVPTLLLKDDRLRVYFATRPKQGLSVTTYCDLDINNLENILYIHNKPILELGNAGTFDQHGIMPSSIVNKDGIIYLYYSGWCRSVGVPYSNYTGLAVSEDGGTNFRKLFKGPIIDRTPLELFSATSPEVYYNGAWHMWYCSGTNWHKVKNKLEHTYDIKYASSIDGITWSRCNKIAIPQKNEYEAITKPTMLSHNGLFHMWYCYRGSFDFRAGADSYKIGYAFSKDLINWERKDNNVGLEPTKRGWDSEMSAYPAVIKIHSDFYMFYNGNNFGEEGFGFAKLASTSPF